MCDLEGDFNCGLVSNGGGGWYLNELEDDEEAEVVVVVVFMDFKDNWGFNNEDVSEANWEFLLFIVLGLEWEYWLETGAGGGGGGGGGVLGHSNGRMNLDLLFNEVGGVNNNWDSW